MIDVKRKDGLATMNFGIININTELLKSMEFDIVSLIFSRFIPVKIEHEFHGISRYTGYSPEFDKTIEGEQTPVYDCIMTYMGDNNNLNAKYSVEFKRLS